jgi:hypothetical protein
MTIQFEADLDPEMGWPRVRFNFNNGWSASVVIRTRPRNDPTNAMQSSLACCPTGKWGTGATELGETEATADEVAAYLARVAARPAL